MTETHRRTLERSAGRNDKISPRGRRRSPLDTELGRKSLQLFLQPLTDCIQSRIPTAPEQLGSVVSRLPRADLAAMTLNTVQENIFWPDEARPDSKRSFYLAAGIYLKNRMEFAEDSNEPAGEYIKKRGRPRKERFSKDEWGELEYITAGWWLVDAAITSGYFVWKVRRLPKKKTQEFWIEIAPQYQSEFDKIRDHLIWADPYHMPYLSPPPDWTGWRKHYDRRISAKIVRGWRTDQREEIERRFAEPFPHAEALNHRKDVGLRVNQAMLPVVEKFAVECMGHEGWKFKNDVETLKGDLRDARWISDSRFYLDYSCDERGRMYAQQYFNYDRGDHIRALIEFDRPVYCGAIGRHWLDINCATLFGLDKAELGERLRWAADHMDFIRAIARDPIGTFDKWKNADKRLQFVRACLDVVEANENPDFETRLPVGVDATGSGLQNLALSSRDAETMAKVNLVHTTSAIMDIYDDVAGRVVRLLKSRLEDPWSAWWLERLKELGNKRRKLFKGPVGTFAYSSTKPSWVDQIIASYDELRHKGALSVPIPRDWNGDYEARGRGRKKTAIGYLTDLIDIACREELRGPTAVMEWLQQQVRLSDSFLSWDGLSGWPCRNLEEYPNNQPKVTLPNGDQIVYAQGTTGVIDSKECLKGISPNFVHSLDAAHAALTINAWGRDVITCHDCLYGHAPLMYQLQETALIEYARIYRENDPLHELWIKNGRKGDPPPKFITDERLWLELMDKMVSCKNAFS